MKIFRWGTKKKRWGTADKKYVIGSDETGVLFVLHGILITHSEWSEIETHQNLFFSVFCYFSYILRSVWIPFTTMYHVMRRCIICFFFFSSSRYEHNIIQSITLSLLWIRCHVCCILMFVIQQNLFSHQSKSVRGIYRSTFLFFFFGLLHSFLFYYFSVSSCTRILICFD